MEIQSNLGVSSIGVPTLDFTLPSGNTLRIREQNGEDDDILSKVKDNRDGSAMHNFIAQIILELNGQAVKLTAAEVAKWKLRDKYFTLFKSRKFSLGDLVIFDHKFMDGTTIGFEENLTQYDYDYSTLSVKSMPKKGESGYNSLLAQPYPNGKDSIEHTLTSGKKIMYDFMTGVYEGETLTRDEATMSINDKLRYRKFKLFHEGKWEVIERFNMFTSREMHEIRTHLEVNDPDFTLTSVVKNPDTGMNETISLLMVQDFFFPVG